MHFYPDCRTWSDQGKNGTSREKWRGQLGSHQWSFWGHASGDWHHLPSHSSPVRQGRQHKSTPAEDRFQDTEMNILALRRERQKKGMLLSSWCGNVTASRPLSGKSIIKSHAIALRADFITVERRKCRPYMFRRSTALDHLPNHIPPWIFTLSSRVCRGIRTINL